ncbi:hypothetical protein R1flu_015556 [Riccia fluitans]|uniref:Protein CASP n=1 Tax=Riccia fluitans TaxID=41844 RepID=A0ABD1YJP6_9MARC
MDGVEDTVAGDGAGDREKEMRSPQGFNSPSPIAVILNYWKEFDLEREKGKLDEQGLRIGENQENSLKNRRKLAESTRDFKKAEPEEKIKLFASLLKGYQEEVDNLTKRAKYGENAFLNIYQKLYEAPDPLPGLVSADELATKVGELEIENRKMKQELEEFRTEAAHLKNQQATVRRLEERNRLLEQQMEEKVKEVVEMNKRSLAEENSKNLEVLKERERSLQDQLRAAKESVQNMQRLHELGQSQLFEFRAQSEEERAAKQSELNLLTDEVDRAEARLLSLEREKEQLRTQLQSVHNQEAQYREKLDNETSSSLEASLTVKEKIISELHLELHKLEATLASERDEHLSDVKKFTALVHEKDLAIEDLKREISERPTLKVVEDLRKQVKILQAVGYNSIEAEDWEIATRGEDIGKLETLLLDKNRKMEHELTQVKVQLSEKTSAVTLFEVQVKELEQKVDEQKMLITKLEEDILKGYNSADRRSTRPDEWESTESGIPTDLFEHTGGAKQSGPEEERNSMLDVICSQRDRFRQRLREAEEELRLVKEKNRTLELDLERSKADNVKLYEKMRYVQDYTQDRPIPRGKKTVGIWTRMIMVLETDGVAVRKTDTCPNVSTLSLCITDQNHDLRVCLKHLLLVLQRIEDLESGTGVDIESKYKKMYEEDINPFAQFSKKEKERRYKELGIRDKITLSSGRFLLGNKYARTFIFFYSIGLHLLVFMSLYRLSAESYYNVRKDATVHNANIKPYFKPSNTTGQL